MKDVYKIDIPINGDAIHLLSKKQTNLTVMGYNSHFIICIDTSFSSMKVNVPSAVIFSLKIRLLMGLFRGGFHTLKARRLKRGQSSSS